MALIFALSFFDLSLLCLFILFFYLHILIYMFHFVFCLLVYCCFLFYSVVCFVYFLVLFSFIFFICLFVYSFFFFFQLFGFHYNYVFIALFCSNISKILFFFIIKLTFSTSRGQGNRVRISRFASRYVITISHSGRRWDG